MKFLLLECQLDWYNRYLCINNRVSESYRAWLSDLRIQIRVPRLPGATGLNPVNQLFPLSEADKAGSKKPALCEECSGDLSMTPSNHGLTTLWKH